MAVAIASGSDYFSTAGLPTSGNPYTITVWVKWTTQVAWACIWSLDAGTSDHHYIERDDTASTFRVYDEGGAKGSTMTLSTGSWKFVAVSYNGSTFSFYSGNESGGALTTHNTGTSIGTISPTRLRISESPWGGEDFVGSFAHFKMWDAALTQSEIATEKESASAVRTSNLNRSYDWTSGPSTTDGSGNGRTLSTTGSGFTNDTDNPILTGARTVSGAATAPAATAAATVDVDVAVSGAATAPAATAAGTLDVVAQSSDMSGASVAPAATATGVVDVLVAASGTATAPAATAAGTVDVDVSVAAAATAPAATGSGTVGVDVALSGAATAPQATAAGTADVDVAVSGAATAPAATGSGTLDGDTTSVDMSGASTAPAATSSASVDVDVALTGASVAPAAVGAGTVTVELDLAGGSVAPSAAAAATVTVTVSMSGVAVAPAATAAGTIVDPGASVVRTVTLAGSHTGTATLAGTHTTTTELAGAHTGTVTLEGSL